MMTDMIDKKDLRATLIEKRFAIPPEIARAASVKLGAQLQSLIPTGARIAGYSAIRGEIAVDIDVSALPIVLADTKILKFLAYKKGLPLVIGKYGVSCPPLHMPEIIPDVVIVPLVGFDANKNRLGYGGGYYDATIKHLRSIKPTILVVGVAYDLQKLDDIPVEPHDQKMDMIVTESGVVK